MCPPSLLFLKLGSSSIMNGDDMATETVKEDVDALPGLARPSNING